ncbi:3-methyl-2-oxobutanoate hydroxymethyltransferase [Corynebacterium glutamicum MT]|nr:3-methyl-2-oxobutanoate hydroxymethyltransferase [Corynebacterium glutamicum SCgG1]AGN20794.1 3-methyl-2-oxobutanoate hydroxymethyltransferase [Corynebacterium glutamicum SCgG2]EGV39929.1 3-methyl-2-oxobutanoate hydroxymethyltransferase [Corynebacterium glutamicum S9114]EOA66010.1 3-methyl-2-oxobutanoate hydroxymethyltransferase [Corynebacterium glutamicum MT]EPP42077.1 3-methyl-2-oxobutanoate hydroxymethyltransferase [Corynebacterium glutamicum Z188]
MPMSGIDAKKIRTRHFREAKVNGQKVSVLTSYDALSARIFDEAGVDMLLVGDSAANVVLGRDTTLSVTLDEMIVLAKAVTIATKRALVVVDLPFGTYEVSPNQAVESAIRVMRETGAAAVKIEGGVEIAQTIRRIVDAGIPVVGHIGYTPQSEHSLGGHVVQGRGASSGKLIADARAVEQAGAFAVVLEMVPAEAAREVTEDLSITTIGIGAGNGTDGQVLVWQDAFGLNRGKKPRFVREYAALGDSLNDAAQAYIADIHAGTFPGEAESF